MLSLAVLVGFVASLPRTYVASTKPPSRAFPLEGIVKSSTADGLVLRDAPPVATAFSYQLADRICGLGNGTKFIATDQVYILNGEIWFRIHATDIVQLGGSECPSDRVRGWMVARTKTSWVVMVLRQGVTLSAQYSPENAGIGRIEEEETQSIEPLLDYLFLLLGTMLAVFVIAIKRAGAVKPAAWLSAFLAFEFCILAVINIVVVATLMDQLLTVDEPNLVFVLFRVIHGADGGVALLGFLLSVVCMRFMSFAKNK